MANAPISSSSRICCSEHSREGSGEHRLIDIALVEESLNLAWHGARAETQGFEVRIV